MVTDGQRRELYDALESTLGAGPAQVMMELLPPVGWSDVARQSDLVAVRGEIAELRGDLMGLRGELKGEMAELRGEMAELRAEVHSQIPRFIMANVPIMAGVAGIVLAAVKLG